MSSGSILMMVWHPLRHNVRAVKAATALAQAGAAVTVVECVPGAVEQAEWSHPHGFRVVSLSRGRPWQFTGGRAHRLGVLLRALRRLPCLFRLAMLAWRSDAAYLHAHDIQTLPSLWLGARGRPLIYDAYEATQDRVGFGPAGRLLSLMEGFFARRVAANIVTTPTRAEDFVDRHAVAQPVVIQNRPFSFRATPSARLREAIGADPSELILLYQGGLQPKRGLERLIEQMPRLSGVRLCFLGDGVLRESLQAQAQQGSAHARIHFLGALPWDALMDWTASADVGVQLLEPSGFNHYSTDSNKIFEYGMAGLPVVASDFPEIRRVVDDVSFGLLVDPQDDDAVCQAIQRLRDEPELRRHFRANALANTEYFGWDREAPKLLDLYANLGWQASGNNRDVVK